jgi:RHS repeat-associated protein
MYNYSAQCVAFVYKYTGKERDPESGLDYFGARHHASALGRFMEPDAVFADQHPGSPQSWNLYTYAANNPLRNRDITGRGVIDWVALGQAVANWFSSGIARDGGVGNFAQNNAIGAAKGAGTFGVNSELQLQSRKWHDRKRQRKRDWDYEQSRWRSLGELRLRFS